jgi:protein TonB
MRVLIIILAILSLNETIHSQNKLENEKVFEFENIEIVPLFERCKPKKKTEKEKKCVKKEIMNFIYGNFKNSLVAELGLWTGKYEINSKFIIGKNGEILNIRVKSENLELKKEMERVLNLMPKFIRSGKMNGINVKTEYSLPFKIYVE